jgi:8-oxo-dGTP diphosphatase
MSQTEPMPLLLAAACALVDADHRVLLTRRPEGKPMTSLWKLPAASCWRRTHEP